jgi:hypothetical protein
MKAAAQRIGLGNATMGMAMIDSVFEKCQLGKGKMAEGGDWADVIKILTAGKVRSKILYSLIVLRTSRTRSLSLMSATWLLVDRP